MKTTQASSDWFMQAWKLHDANDGIFTQTTFICNSHSYEYISTQWLKPRMLQDMEGEPQLLGWCQLAGCVISGKAIHICFLPPISFAYLSTSLTVRCRVPPIWPQDFIAEQTSASFLQSLAFISTLFACLGNDAQRWVLLAGHLCDDHQRTWQKGNVALPVRCKLDTNIAPHNAAQPQWSRGNLAILTVVGLPELWVGLGTKNVCRAATDPSQTPPTSLQASPERCILFLVLCTLLSFILLPLSTPTPIYSSLRSWVENVILHFKGQTKVSINALYACNNKESISEAVANINTRLILQHFIQFLSDAGLMCPCFTTVFKLIVNSPSSCEATACSDL